MRLSNLRLFLALALSLCLVMPAFAGRQLNKANGQTVYVPVYSHIYQGIKGRPYNLSALLSIRNVDAMHSIVVTSVKYYDSQGVVVKEHIVEPMVIGPMSTGEFHVPERDISGGSGANFTVKWKGTDTVTTPIIQAVMIGTASTLGISFVCDGVVVEED
ncbi:DUF3124 domain-containing protein [Pseudodesulfovibrio sediminis]|uniref:DUF3124 domain-containing protein n=1 Tax=Pseudodesulfovibrio sediminis TaxID=2810563 RepID=A0ABN6ETG9_9BACT|nr:DUF3124 domain-containing protein [Pseudodesulfovibrio sediminis]BCS88712.1 hypothetical protein PSDVSF_19540 [Pseudodesulfovibrio sediminis]